jgi:hypothetical protein
MTVRIKAKIGNKTTQMDACFGRKPPSSASSITHATVRGSRRAVRLEGLLRVGLSLTNNQRIEWPLDSGVYYEDRIEMGLRKLFLTVLPSKRLGS